MTKRRTASSGSSKRKAIGEPDYRQSPWNRSKYAPRIAGRNAMSRAAQLPALFQTVWIMLAAFAVIPNMAAIPNNWGGYLFFGLAITWLIAFQVRAAMILRRIRNEEYERLTADDSVTLPDKPVTLSKTPSPAKTTDSHAATAFEHEVANLFNVATSWRAVVVGGAGDGGVDILLYEGGAVVGVVQCKLYKGVVPPLFVRELVTVRNTHKAKIAYLVTTGRFSDATRADADALNIKLVDHERLNELRQKARQRVKDHRTSARRPTME